MMRKTKRILIHVAGWIGYFNLLAWSFSAFNEWGEAFQRGAVVTGLHTLLFYLNLLVLMPKLLERKKVMVYAISLMLALLSVGFFMGGPGKTLLPERRAFQQLNEDGKQKRMRLRQRARLKEESRLIDPRVFGLLISSTAVLFVSAIYFNVQTRRKKEQEMMVLRNQSLEAEQKFLKSQINPHFLFNTLNNLYSLATVKSEKTANAIQQLSEILRYAIYDSENKLVSLEKEIEYIRHYLELESLKDDAISSKVKLEVAGVDTQIQIPPMILLPFIENAFKHGNLAIDEEAYVKIAISSTEHQLHFVCENSLSSGPQTKDKTGGVGLKNVQRRLELLFSDQSDLQIDENTEYFRVALKLNL